MLPLETKQSGGKLLPHSDLRGGGRVFLEEVSRSRKRNRDILLDTWNVRSLSWRVSWGLDGVVSGQGQVAGTCGYGEGLSGSINVGNFLTSCKVYC
jgi:hypothetical protein